MPKDNPFSDNPFGVHDVDPFAAQAPSAPSVRPASAGTWGGGGAWGANNGSAGNGASSSTGGAFNVPQANGGYGGESRKDLLDMKEKELAAKEAELKKWEENLRASGQLKKSRNWPIPRYFAITYHNIPEDVPEDKQRMVYFAYYSYLGFLWCITFNAFASLMAMSVISPGDSRLAGFLLSVVYWFAGVPGAWILWYRRLYNCSRNNRALTYAFFFLFYLVHIGWCAWAAVSPPIPFSFSKWALAGYVEGIKAFGDSIFVGVVFVIGASFWAIEGLWALFVLNKVYFSFRNGGGTSRLKQEAATATVKAGLSSGSKSASSGGGGKGFFGKSKKSSAPLSNLGGTDV